MIAVLWGQWDKQDRQLRGHRLRVRAPPVGVFQGRGSWERNPGLGCVFPEGLPLSTQHGDLKTMVGFGATPHCGCTPKLTLVQLSYGKI